MLVLVPYDSLLMQIVSIVSVECTRQAKKIAEKRLKCYGHVKRMEEGIRARANKGVLVLVLDI